MEELEDKIHDYICNYYDQKYIGHLKVTKNGTIYTLVIGLPTAEHPTYLSIQADTDEEFLQFACKEIRDNRYTTNMVDSYEIRRTDVQ